MAQSKPVVLIIEDEAGFRRVYADALEYEGFSVLSAKDGAQGLKLIKSKRPDAILLDLILPKLPGLELLKQIKNDDQLRNIPVLICSVLGQDVTIKKAMELGANKYFYKGKVSPDEIAKACRQVLAE